MSTSGGSDAPSPVGKKGSGEVKRQLKEIAVQLHTETLLQAEEEGVPDAGAVVAAAVGAAALDVSVEVGGPAARAPEEVVTRPAVKEGAKPPPPPGTTVAAEPEPPQPPTAPQPSTTAGGGGSVDGDGAAPAVEVDQARAVAPPPAAKMAPIHAPQYFRSPPEASGGGEEAAAAPAAEAAAAAAAAAAAPAAAPTTATATATATATDMPAAAAPVPAPVDDAASPSEKQPAPVTPPARNFDAPVWVPDANSDTCLACGVEFWLFTRRHHCRSCGWLVCDECSTHRKPLDNIVDPAGVQQGVEGEQYRVCAECFDHEPERVREKKPVTGRWVDMLPCCCCGGGGGGCCCCCCC
jgi:hypothetical protein